jgi:hypothetical protein
MLKVVEYGLLAVSLITVLVLIMAGPRATEPAPAETTEPEVQPKLPRAVNR